MEKSYRYSGYFILLIFGIAVLGFFKSYFGKFPNFQGLQYIHHFHFLSLFLWFAMLIVQPILIATHQIKAHRLIGKSSYILMIFIIFFMLQIMELNYTKAISKGDPKEIALGFLYVPFSAMMPFIIIYLLGIYYKRKPAYHMRFMIATAIALLGPAVGRIDFGLKLSLNAYMIFSFGLSDFFLVLLLLFERFKTNVYQPYFISLCICLVFHMLFPWAYQSSIWIKMAGWFIEYWP